MHKRPQLRFLAYGFISSCVAVASLLVLLYSLRFGNGHSGSFNDAFTFGVPFALGIVICLTAISLSGIMQGFRAKRRLGVTLLLSAATTSVGYYIGMFISLNTFGS